MNKPKQIVYDTRVDECYTNCIRSCHLLWAFEYETVQMNESVMADVSINTLIT